MMRPVKSWHAPGDAMKTGILVILTLVLLLSCGRKTGNDTDAAFRFPEPVPLDLELVAEIHPREDWPAEVLMQRLLTMGPDSVYVCAGGGQTAWRLDFKGNVLGPFGRKGQGPGEFQRFISGVFRHGNLWLASGPAFAEFDDQGKVIRHLQLRGFPRYWDVCDAGFVVEEWKLGDEGVAGVSLVVFGPSGAEQQVLVPDGNTGSVPIQIGKALQSAAFGRGVFPTMLWALDAGRDAVYVMDSGTYELKAMNIDGSIRWTFRAADYDEGPSVTGEMADALVERETSMMRVPDMEAYIRKLKAAVPDRVCPIHSMTVTPGGLILVARQRGYEDLVYDALRPDGTICGTFTQPVEMKRELTLTPMGGDLIAEMVHPEGKDTEPFVRIFRVKNPPAGW